MTDDNFNMYWRTLRAFATRLADLLAALQQDDGWVEGKEDDVWRSDAPLEKVPRADLALAFNSIIATLALVLKVDEPVSCRAQGIRRDGARLDFAGHLLRLAQDLIAAFDASSPPPAKHA